METKYCCKNFCSKKENIIGTQVSRVEKSTLRPPLFDVTLTYCEGVYIRILFKGGYVDTTCISAPLRKNIVIYFSVVHCCLRRFDICINLSPGIISGVYKLCR